MRYYIQRDGNQLVPFTIEELKELLVIGSITKTDHAAVEGETEYRPLAEIMVENQSPNNNFTTENQLNYTGTSFISEQKLNTGKYPEPLSSNYNSTSFQEQTIPTFKLLLCRKKQF